MVYGWGADWPDGFGFLSQIVDSRVIRHAGGNTNLGVKDPAVDAMLDKALLTTDTAAARQIWVDIDKKVMDDAFVIPGVWAKGLLYRPQNLTNVFVTDGFQMYDYLALGTLRAFSGVGKSIALPPQLLPAGCPPSSYSLGRVHLQHQTGGPTRPLGPQYGPMTMIIAGNTTYRGVGVGRLPAYRG